MATVNREQFLQKLESVQPGLSPKEIIEQSSCFVFDGGMVMTFNDEVSCRVKCPLDITGAVSAQKLMALLQKLTNDEIDIEVGKGELLVKASKSKSAGIRMEADVLLPVALVDKPKTWSKLPDTFSEAVDMVHQCAGKDQSHFAITCVHVHPKWLEACDNFQITRYMCKTGISVPTLVRHTSIQHIVPLGMTEISETDSWLHFRNPAGLVFSCRKYLETYDDLSGFLEVTGTPIILPKGLGEATDKAEIFSSEDTDNNQVLVELRPGKLRVRGQGASGWYTEVKRLKYDGPVMIFNISPKLLIQLTERHNECEISPERLKVNGGKYVYVTCLSIPKDEKETSNGGAEAGDGNGEEAGED